MHIGKIKAKGIGKKYLVNNKKEYMDIGINININEYVKWTNVVREQSGSKKSDNIRTLQKMLMVIAKLQNILTNNLIHNTKIDLIDLRERVGDAIFHLSSFCQINDFDLDTIIGVNVAKAMRQYPKKFSKWKQKPLF